MEGMPSIMQAMLDEVASKLKIGVPMLSQTVRADLAGEAEWRTGAAMAQAKKRGAARKATLTRNAYCAALCRDTLISNFPVPIAAGV